MPLILIVDDVPHIRRLVRHCLEERHDVREAEFAEQALEIEGLLATAVNILPGSLA